MSERSSVVANQPRQLENVDLNNQNGASADRASEMRKNAAPSKMEILTPQDQVNDLVANRNLSTDERLKQFKHIQDGYKFSDYDMRRLVGEAYNKNSKDLLAKANTPEEINALTREFKAVHDKYKNGIFGFNEIKSYDDALHAKEKTVLDAAAKAQREAREQARQREIEQRNGVVREGETHAGEILNRKDIGMPEKLRQLEKVQKDLKLSDQEMREFLGRVLKTNEGSILSQATDKESAIQMKRDMELMDRKFGRLGGLWENNAIQDKVDNQIKGYERAEKKAREIEHREREAARKEERAKLEAEKRAEKDRIAAEKKAEHDRQVADAREKINARESKAAEILLDKNASGYNKVERLLALKDELKLSSYELRKLIGDSLNSRGGEVLKGLSAADARKLRTDMDILDKNLGVLGHMSENNDFEGKLKRVK